MTAASHQHTDPTIPGKDPDGDWLTLSAALTGMTLELTGLHDVVVRCAPGAGRGAPGCWVPALATIELDGTHLPISPAKADPTDPVDRDRYPALWGVFTHEAAHVRFSRWDPPPGEVATAAAQAAILLDEPRIEGRHLGNRPGDRHWLRAAATEIILPSFTTRPDPPEPSPPVASAAPPPAAAAPAPLGGPGTTVPASPPPAVPPTPTPTPTASVAPAGASSPDPAVPSSPDPAAAPAAGSGARGSWDAGQAAGLLLARTDAGVLDEDETRDVAAAVRDRLGDDRYTALREVWQAALATPDQDGTTMLALGRRWCEILNIAPDTEPPPPDAGTGTGTVGASPLTEAVEATVAAVVASTRPTGTAASRVRAAERQARDRSARTAQKVFDPPRGTARRAGRVRTRTRVPTTEEQAAARRLARTLRRAGQRERVTTVITSATPPGRLRMRAALARDAQRAAGAVPSAEPFTQTLRRHSPTPPLRVGIACDTSLSMDTFARPVASTAWICARAVSHVHDARTATVLFGEVVQPLTWPGRAPAAVTEFDVAGGYEAITAAADALDGALDLTRPDAARLLVVISDGRFFPAERDTGQQRINRLTRAGCPVLWIGPAHATPLRGTHSITLTDPAATADAIAHAVTTTLARTT